MVLSALNLFSEKSFSPNSTPYLVGLFWLKKALTAEGIKYTKDLAVRFHDEWLPDLKVGINATKEKLIEGTKEFAKSLKGDK